MVNRSGEFQESEVTNHELIDGLIGGNPRAASLFHHRYSTRISRWVWRLLGTDREHDDVVQQVFLNVFASLSRINNADSLGSWVDSVTIKTVRYELRKRKARRALFLARSDADADEPVDERSPFQQHHVKNFYKILSRMPADDRIVFVLKFLEGYTIDDIASIGNYSPSTAKRRLRRAKSLFVQKALRDFTLISLAEECHAI